MKTPSDIFSELGERLAAFGNDAATSDVIAAAYTANDWFTPEDIRFAVNALREDMLQRDKLTAWLSQYDIPDVERQKNVAIIMAGNIPLVGFFDLLCVIASGNRAIIKPSSKDSVLMSYIADTLRQIEPQIAIEAYDAANRTDAVIATGSDNAKRLFKSAFSGKPSLLRGNRHSVAVLSGHETDKDIAGLNEDIFRYSGLGCRNVSMLFVPRGYIPKIEATTINDKYLNNYRQNRALLSMIGTPHTDMGGYILQQSDEFPTAISTVCYVEYDTLSEVAEWLANHDNELQCVVTECIEHPRRVPFGQAQHPRLTDYPDDNDVMAFLLSI